LTMSHRSSGRASPSRDAVRHPRRPQRLIANTEQAAPRGFGRGNRSSDTSRCRIDLVQPARAPDLHRVFQNPERTGTGTDVHWIALEGERRNNRPRLGVQAFQQAVTRFLPCAGRVGKTSDPHARVF
jgi:hypothetical protein